MGFETFSYVKLFQFCFNKLAQLLSALNFGKVVFLAVQEQLYSSFQRSGVASSKCLARILQAYFLTFHSPAPHNTLCLPTPPPPLPKKNKWVSGIVSKCSWEYCIFPRAFEGAVKPRYNESSFNEVLGRTIVFTPVILKYMKNDITKTSYGQQILPFPWSLVTSRFLKERRTECFIGDSKIVNLKSKKKKHACGIVQMLKLYKHEGKQRVIHYLVHKEAFIWRRWKLLGCW